MMQTNLVPSAQRPREHGPEFGYFAAVATHALGARRHMFDYGTTREDFAAIAIAFREHMHGMQQPRRRHARSADPG